MRGIVNGYEDIDLCLKVRQRGRSVVCCTKSFIYHYGQITETRTADDDSNRARLMAEWRDRIEPDELSYFRQDQAQIAQGPSAASRVVAPRAAGSDSIYFADDLSAGSALTWATVDLVLALQRQGAPVAIKKSELSSSIEPDKRRVLESLMLPRQPVGGIQIRWSHYWPQHLGLDLMGRHNLELFVINYLFDKPGSQPWDYWLQCLPQNQLLEAAVERASAVMCCCRSAFLPMNATSCGPGYSAEVHQVEAPARQSGTFRFLTVTNSHDLERYGTKLLLDAYRQAFSAQDDVVARHQGLRRHLGRHDAAGSAPECRAAPGARRVRLDVHDESRPDRTLQVLRCVRVGSPRRRLRDEAARCDGVRPSGRHSAVRRPDRFLHRVELLSGRVHAGPGRGLPGHSFPADYQLAGVG